MDRLVPFCGPVPRLLAALVVPVAGLHGQAVGDLA